METTEKISSMYVQVNSCGKQILIDKNYSTMRSRVDYYILYIIKGKCYAVFEKTEQIVDKGNMLLYYPGSHQNYRFYASDKSETFWAHFSGTECSNIATTCGFDRTGIYNIGGSNLTEDIFSRLIMEYNLKKPHFETICGGYLIQLFAQMARDKELLIQGTKEKNNQIIYNVIEHMYDNLKQPANIDFYAQMCALSKDRFIHLFKERTGLSPHLFQTQIRIDKARSLLISTSLNVSEVSKIMGFDDFSYFSRVFKKHTGKSPSYYKK